MPKKCGRRSRPTREKGRKEGRKKKGKKRVFPSSPPLCLYLLVFTRFLATSLFNRMIRKILLPRMYHISRPLVLIRQPARGEEGGEAPWRSVLKICGATIGCGTRRHRPYYREELEEYRSRRSRNPFWPLFTWNLSCVSSDRVGWGEEGEVEGDRILKRKWRQLFCSKL